ncbi:hypothetical protein AWB75_04610 [Caballeronia catudaia]|uniref:Uncharacterized protein n=1 Tax=Caballeronia catudaia TaxID=1777136 RepID=A0A158C6R6_9BURK|nr:hypothetical protein AWB75_04610 [Caballeronia catudaia]
MRATDRRGAKPVLACRLARMLSLALYMSDPIRQMADERLVAAYVGETESNLRGPADTIGPTRTARKER